MPTDLPDLRQVRAFVSVAETESFTKAAERLFLTQSAVSYSIRGLEEQLGTQLVERLGKRIGLTQDGVVYLRRCRAVLQELEAAGQELDALKRWGQGRIRIGATHSLCQYLLPVVLREFRETFPRCEIHIESGDTSELLGLLDETKIDLVLGMESRVQPWCRYQEFFRDELAFVVSPQHPWASLEKVGVEEAGQESYLVYARKSETYRLTREHFAKAGLRFRATLCLGSMEAIKEMAKIGIGVGIVSPWVVRTEIEAGELVHIPIWDSPPARSWGLFVHETRKLSVVEDAFVDLCETVSKGF